MSQQTLTGYVCKQRIDPAQTGYITGSQGNNYHVEWYSGE